ncbi:uncharacterized protein B0T15DRAFT_497150 [Chaetomium strumarium]|uniref:Uncharacterized protein n=1 Tax=Chaetomium strumarium TaxID=1170767 RepID=A0AAJ0GMH8_9PEZI|nr:hypothetical protein B0T15DRAFT_497150 [Chaetomium strumarium]
MSLRAPPGFPIAAGAQFYNFTHGGTTFTKVQLRFESCRRAKIAIPFNILTQLDSAIDIGRLMQSQNEGMTFYEFRRKPGQKIKYHIAEAIHPGSSCQWMDGNWSIVREPGLGAITFEMARGENGFDAKEYIRLTVAELRFEEGKKLLSCTAEYVVEGDRVPAGGEAPRLQDPSAPEEPGFPGFSAKGNTMVLAADLSPNQ